jgi:hypothetical protein
MDTFEIYGLIWERFKKYGVFDEFKEELFNRRVRVGYFRLSKIKPELREVFLERFKKNIEEINEEFYDFYETVDVRCKKILTLVEELNDPREIIIQAEQFDNDLLREKNRKLKEKNKKLKEKNKKLKEKNKKLKETNKQILDSNSWKLTKSLRSAKNKFK